MERGRAHRRFYRADVDPADEVHVEVRRPWQGFVRHPVQRCQSALLNAPQVETTRLQLCDIPSGRRGNRVEEMRRESRRHADCRNPPDPRFPLLPARCP